MHLYKKTDKRKVHLCFFYFFMIACTQVQAQINYIRTFDATAPEQNVNVFMGRWVSDVKTATQYIDGLGRPIQTVVKQGSLESSSNTIADIVAPIIYDEFGREPLKYLPFAANNAGGNTNINNGAYKTNALVQQVVFATAQYPGENNFYSKTNFEPSPLNRPTDTYAPGTSWAGSEANTNPALQRNVQMKYYINTAADDVKIWNVIDNPVIGNFGTYQGVGGGYQNSYPAGELYKTIAIDEHKKQVIEFKDKEGKVILKKVQLTAADDNGEGANTSGWLCTYYIYDDLNNLRCVIQPEAVKLLPTYYNNLTATLLSEQCFRYEYDQRNRMVRKKVPGAGDVCMVYDSKDRLVMTQDANMRNQQKWMYTTYDIFNRPSTTGLITDPVNYNNLSYHLSAANASTTDYPNISTFIYEKLSTNFYDGYSWLIYYSNTNLSATYNNTFDTYFQTPSNTSWPYAQANTAVLQLKGMPTGSRVKVLGTSDTYLYKIPFYDNKGRLIQIQSTNISGGVDITTTQYTWAGQPLVMVSKQQLAGSNGQSTITVSQLTYDDLGRVIKTEKKLSNTLVNGGAMAAYKTIAENKYDKLGQLVNKKIGNKPNATAGTALAKLDYEYNIRGWLTSVNKNFVTAGNNGANNDEYFGMQLGYDKDAFGNFTKKQYNGNISGSIWRSAGDGVDRKYDYDYDAANRLLKADFTLHNGTAFAFNPLINFNVKMGDGINATSAYDDNGNIKQMQQWGLKINNSVQIDNLAYTYLPNSNKLAKVADVGITATDNGKLGDFKDGTNTGDDYTYDANGNLNIDNNKNIGNIVYNYLNLPQVITIPNKGSITYTYDAGGNKLRKVTLESPTTANSNKTITTTTNYINGLVYESKTTNPTSTLTPNYTDVLQFVPQEEGRIRFKPAAGAVAASFAYDYMLKDHLGNVRVVITEEQQQDVYPAATLEPALVATESSFYTIDASKIVLNSAANEIRDVNNNAQTYQNNNLPIVNNNPSCGTGTLCTSALSAKVYQLNSNTNKTGLGITLKVMAGDRIDVSGKSYYYQNTAGTSSNSSLPILDIITGFLGGATGAVATAVHGSVTPAQINPGTSNVNVNNFFTTQTNQSNVVPNNPRAFINVLFFDEQFNAVDYKVSMVGSNKELKNHLQDLQNLVANKSGFVYIYCSNESPVNVFFDNVQVVHTRGSLLETNEFYAFGLVMQGISSKAAGKMENKIQFMGKEKQDKEFSDGSGLEWNDFGARMFDPQIGRWNHVDPLASKFPHMSPYATFNNNPLRFTDPTGMAPESIHIDSKGNVLLNKNDGDNTVYMHGSKVTTKDVEKAYTSSDHSAGGFKVGELGGNIKSGIIKNILKENKGTASSLPKAFAEGEWVARVAPKQEWDYKNNKSTIFGVAWAFDEDNKAKTGSQTKTSFTDDVLPGNPTWASAADFGNFNAGYTGIYATIPILRQYKWAGAGELLKGHPDAAKRFNQWYGNIAPYGDNQRDYDFNTFGMKAAFMEMSKGFFKF
jgi:RHS repeat-associated protein